LGISAEHASLASSCSSSAKSDRHIPGHPAVRAVIVVRSILAATCLYANLGRKTEETDVLVIAVWLLVCGRIGGGSGAPRPVQEVLETMFRRPVRSALTRTPDELPAMVKQRTNELREWVRKGKRGSGVETQFMRLMARPRSNWEELAMLGDFRFADFVFEWQALEPVALPAYPGSTFRGALGSGLRKVSCVTGAEDCAGCRFHDSCGYGYLFATRTPVPGFRADPNAEVARPYVIVPERNATGRLNAGTGISFTLRLFGRAIDFVPYFLIAAKELQRLGLPGSRGRVQLHRVLARHPVSRRAAVVYDRADGVVRDRVFTVLAKDLEEDASAVRVELEFLTNTALKHHGKVQQRISFHVLISRLLQRIEALCRFHHDGPFELDARQLIISSREVVTVADETRWHAWRRYSSRQRQKVPMDGLRGRIVFEGDLKPYLPLLRVGQFTHVGRGSVMGLGRYVVQTIE